MKKFFKFISSRLLYFVIGIFLAIGATYVYATWDDVKTTSNPGQLSEANWNALVNMLQTSSGGGLSVYRADGTTLLGTFGGFFGTPSVRYGWGYWDSNGTLHAVGATGSINDYSHGTIYYHGAGCTGTKFVVGSGNTKYTDGVVYGTTQSNPFNTVGSSYISSRNYGGSCNSTGSTAYGYVYYLDAQDPDTCAFEDCKVK